MEWHALMLAYPATAHLWPPPVLHKSQFTLECLATQKAIGNFSCNLNFKEEPTVSHHKTSDWHFSILLLLLDNNCHAHVSLSYATVNRKHKSIKCGSVGRWWMDRQTDRWIAASCLSKIRTGICKINPNWRLTHLRCRMWVPVGKINRVACLSTEQEFKL